MRGSPKQVITGDVVVFIVPAVQYFRGVQNAQRGLVSYFFRPFTRAGADGVRDIAGEQCLAERLIITIDVMHIFQETEIDASMGWVSGLPYPWCTPNEAIAGMPRLGRFEPIEAYLQHVQPISPER